MPVANEHTPNAVLAAKRDILHETARQFAFGTASEADLDEAAVAFTAAMEKLAWHNIRGRR
jgi:hypothetical protein